MPIANVGMAAFSADTPLRLFEYEIRDLNPEDVKIEVQFCGICHSDIHVAKGHWKFPVHYPLVPGHEFSGVVKEIGSEVKKFKVGDRVGVGCMVDTCGTCEQCKTGKEHICLNRVNTYNSIDKFGQVTRGGYGKYVVVQESFVLRIPDNVPMDVAAPLLCAGITTYAAAMIAGLKRGGLSVAICGLGGLGHMAVQYAKVMGNHVTVLSRSLKKEELAKKLGADVVIATADQEAMTKVIGSFDYILDTTSQHKSVDSLLDLLKPEGSLVTMAIPDLSQNVEFSPMKLIFGNKSIIGSRIGGVQQHQEMLDYSAEKQIFPMIEVIKGSDVNEAYERVEKGDVHFRFVIDHAATYRSECSS
eukprot:Protomagalhaensia_wolfi_Nauph_80__2820@NODE_292_length_2890_cov_41_289021_g218_i0_p2_GENE_NODE_292_length_2890_cov_41_289021_g218_i0NODE_292_length_2890_cov_41_289021_g218_i0_p2_ORF_typecomplete_len358_score74_07ADH_N/PF08240_12/4_4e34ADH_zinc_N/PF00107_26/5_4e02ADH_zinc_N/PF00107_26/1_3e22Glu_dehyd_C/PF16912_5/1_7e16ADH_zinc_N_2/PF13602_6/1_2e03ADH_zinc_N_2/PF13602_6/5_3e07AlaDh_PNT_C/PF01262_21/1_7e06Shikimate_DH/PF01488_20/2e052Hacid_dh_C/PF02826_19/0_00014AdoHcyase_NAD/PF00670_21/0_0023NAD_b